MVALLAPGSEHRVRGERGMVVLERPAPAVALLRAEGIVDAAALEPILELREQILRECGHIFIFDDLEHLESYASSVRLGLTEWCRRHRGSIREFHLLSRSRMVALGVSVANVVLEQQITVHARREAFEDALALAVERSRS